MKTWLKRVLLGFVAVLIVTLVGAAIFLLTFDPNAYKSKLEQIVYERYERTLSIQGNIELSLFPRIGLAVQGVALSDRDSTDIFASLDSARFAVAIWPLMFNRLVVDHVAVTGFKAWLVRTAEGQFNFGDLVHSDVAEPATPVMASFISTAQAASVLEKTDFQIDIAGLDLKGGEIHFLDHKTGATGRIVQLDVNTGRMTFDQAFDVALKGKVLGDQPQADAMLDVQALVRLNPHERHYSAQRINLQINGQLDNLDAKSVSLRGNLAYKEHDRMFSASNLELQVQGALSGRRPVSELEASLSVPQLLVDRSQAELQLKRLALRAKGKQSDKLFDIALDAPSLSVSPETAKGDPVSGTVKITGQDDVLGVSLAMSGLGGDAFGLTLKELKLDSVYKQKNRVVSVQMSSPATWELFAQRGGLSAMKGDVRIEDAALPGGSFHFPYIGSLSANLVQDELLGNINAVLNGSKIVFNLTAKELDDPRVTFDLKADSLDLNSLFPSAAKATAAASDQDNAAEPDSDAEQKDTPAPVISQEQLDWSFLDVLHVQGKLAIDALKVDDLELEKLHANISAINGQFAVRDISADLYGGSLRSDFSLSSKRDVALDFAATNVQVGPLMGVLTGKQRLQGRGDIQTRLTTRGATMAALVANLDGQVQAHVGDGAWVGFNLTQTVAEASNVLRNAFSGQLPNVANQFDDSRQTPFDALDVKVTFQQGQGQVNVLSLKAPALQVQKGKHASVDLVNQQLDVLLNVTAHGGALSGKAHDLSSLDGIQVPVRVSGPFSALSYQVQWQDIRHRVVKDAIQEGLLDILSKGSGSDFLLPPQSDKSESVKKDPLKSIGDALKGLLKQ